MPSDRKTQASRRNAQLSTGPKIPKVPAYWRGVRVGRRKRGIVRALGR